MPLAIATLTDALEKNAQLHELITNAGHYLAGHWTLTHELHPPSNVRNTENISAWLIDVQTHENEHLLADFLDNIHTPLLFCDVTLAKSLGPLAQGHEKIRQRLLQLDADVALSLQRPASRVCLLGASTGGLPAVKAFIKNIPRDIDICFVYAQHIDAAQLPALVKMFLNDSHYEPVIAYDSQVLAPNQMVIMPPHHVFTITDKRTLSISQTKSWAGSYAPSINQLGINIARVYGEFCNMIIFSGMDNDGSRAAPLIKQGGGLVWTQSPESSISDSMPRECIATGTAQKVDTPEALSTAFQTIYAKSK